MKLLSLRIHQLPGIDAPIRIEDFGPAGNLVLGPNAVGKSSLIRALELLLGVDPRRDPSNLAISARFSDGDRVWTASRSGSALGWNLDGQPAEAPELPRRDQLRYYWLSMEDLAQVDQHDDALVQALQQALAGGYDLNALGENDPFKVRPRLGRTEAGRLRQARRELAAIENDHEQLRRQEARLPELESRRDAAFTARDGIGALERALEMLDARDRRETLTAELAQWPEAMERLRGDELEVLDDLANRAAAIGTEIETARTQQSRSRDKLEATGLAERVPDKSLLASLGHKRVELQSARDRHTNLVEEIDQLQAEEATAREQLGASNPAPRLEPEAVARAEELARELHQARSRVEELSRRTEQTRNRPDPNELDACREAVSALREWLAIRSGGNTRAQTAAAIAAISSLAAGVGGGLAGNYLVATGAGAAVLAAAWAWLECRPGRAGRTARARYTRAGLEPPDAWSRRGVESRLAALEKALLAHESRDQEARQAAALEPELEQARRRLEELESERAELATEYGFDPALAAAGLDRFVRLSSAWHQARSRRRAMENRLETLNREIDQATDAIAKALEAWGYETGDSQDLSVALDDLGQRSDQAVEARREIEEARRQQRELDQRLEDIENQRNGIFGRLGLDPDDFETLEQWVEQRPEWKQKSYDLHAASQEEDGIGQRLATHPELLDQVTRLPIDEARAGIRRELEAAQAAAEPAQRLEEEVRSIRQRLREAGADGKLEAAASTVESARSDLEDRHRETLTAEAATFLLQDIRKAYQADHEPAALSHARALFTRFTHGAWSLELDDTHGLMALDTVAEARRKLPELSSGTRMQLLLAVRLAWTRHLERQSVPLPIFLDEALTTSDEHRFSRVAQSLQELADGEGRQVFYLSARRYERALWEQATGQPPHVIDLARIRFNADPGGESFDFAVPETEPLPRPGDASPEAYARTLGIPPIQPGRPAGALPLFHLLRDDLDTLWGLMEDWRIASLGALEKLLESPAAESAIGTHDLRRRLRDRCGITRHWQAALRFGRGRAIDRGVLEESGRITPAFIDPVAEVAEQADGDPEALVERLREGAVSGFGPARLGELEEWLRQEGHIEERTPLDIDQRLQQVLTACAGSADPKEVRQVVAWLEAGLDPESTGVPGHV